MILMPVRIGFFMAAMLSLFIIETGWSQTANDSLKNLLKTTKQDTLRIPVLIRLAQNLRYTEPNEAEKYCIEILQLSYKHKAYASAGEANKIIGVILDEKGKYDSSIVYYNRSIRDFEKSADTLSINKVRVNIGILLRKIDRNEEAMVYLRQSIPYFDQCNFQFGKLIALENMGVCHFNLDHYDSALFFFNGSNTLANKYGFYEPTITGNIGNCYFQKGQFHLAEEYFTEYLKSVKDQDAKDVFYGTYAYSFAMTKLSLGKFREANKLLNDLYVRSGDLNMSEDEAGEILTALAETEFELGDSRQAYIHLLASKKINDSIASADTKAKMLEIKERFDNEKNVLVIGQLNAQQQLLQAQNKKRSVIIYSLISGAIILVGFSAVVYYSYRKNRKANKIITEQKRELELRNKEKDALIQEIHHRVKNNLQFVSAILEMHNSSESNSENKLNDASRRINSMALVHEMLYSKKTDQLLDIKSYIETLFNYTYNEEDQIAYIIHVLPLDLNVSQCIALGMIISELISNSVKHAFRNTPAPEIIITIAKHSPDSILVNYKDNGEGYTPNKSAGLGTRLIDIFSRQLKGKYETRTNGGFEFTLEFTIHA